MNYDSTDVQVFLAALGITLLVVGLILYVVTSFFFMKIFEKAGVVGKWRAWVPGYNVLVFCKLGDVNPWLPLGIYLATLVISLIPYVQALASLGSLASAAITALAAYRIQAKLGKSPVWLILFFLLGPVWLGVLALDKSTWNRNIGKAPWSDYSFMADTTQWNGIPDQNPAAPAA